MFEKTRMILNLGLQVFVLAYLTGCFVGPGYGGFGQNYNLSDSNVFTYKLYPGKERQQNELSTLELGDVDYISIDGLRVQRSDYDKVDLLPGQHEITLSETFYFSFMVEPSMSKTAQNYIKLTLLPGRTYRLYAERTYGKGYQIYFWIEDVENGTVAGGFKKP